MDEFIVFRMDHGGSIADWYVARDEEHARALLIEDLGRSCGEIDITRLEPHELLTFREDDGDRVTKTANDWARENGFGLLASTEA